MKLGSQLIFYQNCVLTILGVDDQLFKEYTHNMFNNLTQHTNPTNSLNKFVTRPN